MNINCIILAGGRGLRLGRNKILETINNTSLLQRVISQLRFLDSTLIIVTARGQSFPELSGNPELKIVTDTYPGKGPLVGIYTGLAASDSFYNLVVAGDMPFLNQPLLQYMTQITDNFDLIVPRLGDLAEPLHAIYSKNCLAPAEGLLKQDNLSILDLFPLVRVRYVEAEEINRFDTEHLSFFNINTEADLERARKLAGKA